MLLDRLQFLTDSAGDQIDKKNNNQPEEDHIPGIKRPEVVRKEGNDYRCGYPPADALQPSDNQYGEIVNSVLDREVFRADETGIGGIKTPGKPCEEGTDTESQHFLVKQMDAKA